MSPPKCHATSSHRVVAAAVVVVVVVVVVAAAAAAVVVVLVVVAIGGGEGERHQIHLCVQVGMTKHGKFHNPSQVFEVAGGVPSPVGEVWPGW